MKRKHSSDESTSDSLKSGERSDNAVPTDECGPLKLKSIDHSPYGDASKRQMSSLGTRSTSSHNDINQLVKPTLHFTATTLRRVAVTIVVATNGDEVRAQPSLSANTRLPILFIALPAESLKSVLSSLYEAEGQMRNSGAYELDSVLGFLRAFKGDFSWPMQDLAVDNSAIVAAISQVKGILKYSWADGRNGGGSGIGAWRSC